MAPNSSNEDIFITEETRVQKVVPRTYEIVWLNVIVFVYYHLAAVYGLTYKAKMPLQVFLMLCQSLANQNSAIHWVRNHRLHHKVMISLGSGPHFSDTDADPHNSSRGFFYSHVGWVMVKKHPEAKLKGRLIDLSDVYGNPVLRFQQRNANWLITIIAFVLPTVIPFLWNEALTIAYHLNMLRYVLTLNATFSVNSVAHMWGHRPYDKRISPAENLSVSIMTLGEGSHNYHHVFPYDYRTAELGGSFLNPTTIFIDFCALIGQAYDRRYVDKES
ncbi:Fatty-acyl-CoA desaturase, partial [Operophtera brumata]